MIVLGIETSGPVGSLALRRDGRCVEERFLPGLGRRHAQSLVPEVASLLRRHLAGPRIDAVAVSVGPGSFTGLRVGVTVAKAYAYATGATLVAVETFLAIAENVPSEVRLTVLADAQRGGVIRGRYERRRDGKIARVGELELVSPEVFAGSLDGREFVTGPGCARLPAGPFRVAAPSLWTSRASAVARLGESSAGAGAVADPFELEPLYVRKSGAEENREAADRGGPARQCGAAG